MKNITNTLEEKILDQYKIVVDDAFGCGEDYLPYFIVEDGGIYWCKEEFMYWFRTSKNKGKITFSGFDYSLKIKDSTLKKIKEVFALIEEWIGVPKKERTTFSYIRFEYEGEDYDGEDTVFHFTGLQINDSSFWLQSLVKMELFCCLYKSLFDWNYSRLSKTAVIKQLRNGDYFEEDGMIWALFNWRELQEIAGKGGKEARWLYNYNCTGLLDAMRNYIYKHLDKDQERAIIKYEPSKSTSRVLLSKS